MREIKLDLLHWKLAGLHFENSGCNILALHGWLDNAASFATLAPLLNANVVALDWTGHGLSDRRPAGTLLHMHDLVYEVIAAMNELGWDKCILLGHSLGAAVATLVAGSFPNRVEKLFLIDGLGPMVRDENENPRIMNRAIQQLLNVENKKSKVYNNISDALEKRAQASGISTAEIEPVVQRGMMKVKDGYIWRTDPRLLIPSSIGLTENQVLAFIRHISAPTTLIRPYEGFDYRTASLSNRAKCLQQLSLIEIAGHHHVHLQYPQSVAEILNSALEG